MAQPDYVARIREAEQKAAGIVAEAKEEAARVTEQAVAEAQETVRKAYAESEALRREERQRTEEKAKAMLLPAAADDNEGFSPAALQAAAGKTAERIVNALGNR